MEARTSAPPGTGLVGACSPWRLRRRSNALSRRAVPGHGVSIFALDATARRSPIMVGTWGPKTCELASEVADAVKVSPMWSAKYATLLWERIIAGTQRVGRAPEDVTFTVGVLTSTAEDQAEAKAYARRALAVYLPFLSPTTEHVGIDEAPLRRIEFGAPHGPNQAEAIRLLREQVLPSTESILTRCP